MQVKRFLVLVLARFNRDAIIGVKKNNKKHLEGYDKDSNCVYRWLLIYF